MGGSYGLGWCPTHFFCNLNRVELFILCNLNRFELFIPCNLNRVELFMLTCNNYFSAGSVAIVGQPATLPVLGLIVPTVYSHLSHPIIPVDSFISGTVAADLGGIGRLYYGSRRGNPMLTAFTPISSNTKTGAIPTTTSDRSTCWTGCPFYNKGCYAKSGPQSIHWRAVSAGERGYEWDAFLRLIRKLNRGQLWRHNVSGDLPTVSDGIIDGNKVAELVDANRGRKGYTYTHHPLTETNLGVIKYANAAGFTINASCESVDDADRVMSEYNIPAVAVVKSEETRRFFTTTNGRKVVTCPATIHDNVTCATCGLCQVADRQFVIAFPAHGVAKKTVNQIVG